MIFINLSAQAQTADAIIDRDEILIGEQAILSLSCRINKDDPQSIVFPQLADTLLKNVEIVSRSTIDTLTTGENTSETRLEQRFFITSFDTGYYVIPPLEFRIGTNTEKTQPMLFSVKTVEIDTTAGIKPSLGNYEVNVGFSDYVKVYWPYAAGAAGLLALAAFLFVGYKRLKKKPKVVEEPVVVEVRSAHEIAIERLNEIKKEAIYKDGNIKEFHTQVTDTLRDYIERQFDVHTHEQTSTQILKALKYSGLSEKSTRRLRTILFRADMVKFAKLKPDIVENEQAISEAIDFVNENNSEEKDG